MTEDELIEKVAGEMADADNEGGDYGMTGADVMDCERGREAYVKRARAALSAIREALQEPTWEMIDAMRMAWRTTQRPGVSGMTIDAQFAAEHAREYAAYRAVLSASFLKGET